MANISLAALQAHIAALQKIVDDGFASDDEVASIPFDDIRQRAASIMAMVGPAAATDAPPSGHEDLPRKLAASASDSRRTTVAMDSRALAKSFRERGPSDPLFGMDSYAHRPMDPRHSLASVLVPVESGPDESSGMLANVDSVFGTG